MRNSIWALVLLGLTGGAGSIAQASKYTYFPDSHMYAGSGFDFQRPAEAFRDCVLHDGEKAMGSPGHNRSDNSRVALKLLKTREDFYQFINFSASLGGSYKFFSGSASYQFEQEDKFHSDSITWGIVFETNYGIYALKNPRLDPQFRTLSKEKLRATCGSEVVLKTRKAVSVFATFTLRNVEEKHYRKIVANAGVDLKGGVWSAQMKASYENILNTALARSQLEMEIFLVGGEGIMKLSDLASTGSIPGENPYDTFKRVPEVIARYISTLSADQAANLEFYTGDITSFMSAVPDEKDPFVGLQLGSMYTAYIEADSALARINSILRTDRALYDLDAATESMLQTARVNLRAMKNELHLAAQECRKPKGQCLYPPNLEVPDIRWPEIRVGACEKHRRIAVDVGCIDARQAEYGRLTDQIPGCHQPDVGKPPQLFGWSYCKD